LPGNNVRLNCPRGDIPADRLHFFTSEITAPLIQGAQREPNETQGFFPVLASHVGHGGSLPVTGIFVLMVFYTIFFAAPVLIPITVSLLLSLVFAPFVDKLEAMRVPRAIASGVIMFAFFGLLVTALVTLAAPAREWVTMLSPVAIFIAIILWSRMWGIVSALLAALSSPCFQDRLRKNPAAVASC
jgi:predicted PurR-regulated permease PerM